MTNFTGQTVLVTGGGTGIGRATSLLFAQHGANVVVNYSRSEKEAEQTAADVRELGVKAIAVQANVADNDAVVAMVDRTVSEFGRLDVLVNNAGTTHIVPYLELDELSEDKWDDILGVNVKGTFFCSRAAIAEMKKAGSGHIVNVTSIAGITGRGSSIAYAASKAALNNMTKAMALSQAPDIRVNAVAPGVVMTRWVKGWEQYTDAHKDETPMKRLAQPEDVAKAIYALACNEFITGEIMTVDGGRLLNV
ncbi:MAG: SDR family NAD(P)-dependent oxidoreductase [Planctomycetaceae bacterium]